MDTITFFLSFELKKKFKLKTLENDTDMTKVLVDLIKKYVEEK